MSFESKLGTNNNKTPKQSHVYDVEEVEQNDLQTDMEADPEDEGTTKLINEQEPAITPEDLDDNQDELRTTRRSTRNKGPVNRLNFHTKGTHSSLKSLVKGFLLGLTIHWNYESIKPRKVGIQGRQLELNQNPKQFHIGTLGPAKSNKLQELQTLDMFQDMMDPDPDDHIWKCIAITKHKVRDINMDDIHIKVKAVWTNGEARILDTT
jgi:hypothetical protein